MIVIAITTGQFELHESRQYAAPSPRVIKLTQFFRNRLGSGQLKILSETIPQHEDQMEKMQAELDRKFKELGGDISKLIEVLREESVEPTPEVPKQPAASKGKAKVSKE